MILKVTLILKRHKKDMSLSSSITLKNHVRVPLYCHVTNQLSHVRFVLKNYLFHFIHYRKKKKKNIGVVRLSPHIMVAVKPPIRGFRDGPTPSPPILGGGWDTFLRS
jgi:hypothetical protein